MISQRRTDPPSFLKVKRRETRNENTFDPHDTTAATCSGRVRTLAKLIVRRGNDCLGNLYAMRMIGKKCEGFIHIESEEISAIHHCDPIPRGSHFVTIESRS